MIERLKLEWYAHLNDSQRKPEGIRMSGFKMLKYRGTKWRVRIQW